jgi:hypothetical protein
MQRLLHTIRALIGVRRERVENSDPGREREVAANGADASIAATEDGWFKVSPYGVFPGTRPGRPQHFGPEEAREMAANFRSLAARIGRLFRGAPIYIGHPDVDPARWPDERRLGGLRDLEARDDGLYAQAEWNSLGQDNLREGFWIYPSPHWDAPRGRPAFRPDRLLSVGLTNMPRIAESEPVANAETTNQDTDTMNRQAICQALGLAPEATDEEILAAIKALADKSAAMEQDMTSSKQEAAAKEVAANSAATALHAMRTARAKELLDEAVEQGRLTPADRPAREAAFAADYEAAANSLAAVGMPQGGGNRPLDLSKAREAVANARDKWNEAVEEIMAKRGVGYDQAWAIAKTDPATRPLWQAMAGPAK